MDGSPQSRQFSITRLLVITAVVAAALRLGMWLPAWAIAIGSVLWWWVTWRLVPRPWSVDPRENSVGLMALLLSFLCWGITLLGMFMGQILLRGSGNDQGYSLLMIVSVLVMQLGLVVMLTGFMGLMLGCRRAATLAIANLILTAFTVVWFIRHLGDGVS